MTELKDWYQHQESELPKIENSYVDTSRRFNNDQVNNVCNLIYDFIDKCGRNPFSDHPDVTIFCDYDTDGVCSGKVAYECFKIAGMDSRHLHIFPDDRVQGFGFDETYARAVMNKYPQTGLIFTCDNGTSCSPAPEYLKSQGVKLVITDHHPQDQTEYDKLGNFNKYLINPVCFQSDYPFKELSGTGVVWKLFQRYFSIIQVSGDLITEKNEMRKFHRLIQYVALSVSSDLMSMTDENRTFVKNGLRFINNDSDKFWNSMKDQFSDKFHPELDEQDFGWKIAPVINADSRIHLNPLISLMTVIPEKRQELISKNKILKKYVDKNIDLTKDPLLSPEMTQQLIDKLIENNHFRQQIVSDLLQEIGNNKVTSHVVEINQDMLDEKTIKEYQKLTGRDKVDLSPIAGIIAGRMQQQTNAPSIVVSEEDRGNGPQYYGSARSNDHFDLLTLTEENSGFKGVAIHGHEQAAGAMIAGDNFIESVADIDRLIDQTYTKPNFIPSDALSPEGVTVEQVKNVEKLAPFGNGFDKPYFVLHAQIGTNPDFTIQRIRTHAGKQHLKILQKDQDYQAMVWNIDQNSELIQAVMAYELKKIPFEIELGGTIGLGKFRNDEYPQIATNSTNVKVVK